jgi:hypothetical protein
VKRRNTSSYILVLSETSSVALVKYKKSLEYTEPVGLNSIFLPGKWIKERFSRKNTFIPFAAVEFVIGRAFKEENFFFLSARKIHEILLSAFIMETF